MKEQLTLDKLHSFLGNTFKSPSSSVIKRKQYNGEIALLPNEDMTFIAKITTNSTDRDNEVIDPMGIDTTSYEQNPVVLWDHQHSEMPIGKIVEIDKQKDAVFAKIKMADHSKALEVWNLIKEGFVKACSIGFVVKETLTNGTVEFIQKAKELGIDIKETMTIITSSELIENSLVSIPANKEALITAISSKSISLSDEMQKDLDVFKGDEMNKIEIKAESAESAESTENAESAESVENVEVNNENMDITTITIGGVEYDVIRKVEESEEIDGKPETTENTENTEEPAKDGKEDTEANTETSEQNKEDETDETDEVKEDPKDTDDKKEDGKEQKPEKEEGKWIVIREGKYLNTNRDYIKAKKMLKGEIV